MKFPKPAPLEYGAWSPLPQNLNTRSHPNRWEERYPGFDPKILAFHPCDLAHGRKHRRFIGRGFFQQVFCLYMVIVSFFKGIDMLDIRIKINIIESKASSQSRRVSRKYGRDVVLAEFFGKQQRRTRQPFMAVNHRFYRSIRCNCSISLPAAQPQTTGSSNSNADSIESILYEFQSSNL